MNSFRSPGLLLVLAGALVALTACTPPDVEPSPTATSPSASPTPTATADALSAPAPVFDVDCGDLASAGTLADALGVGVTSIDPAEFCWFLGPK